MGDGRLLLSKYDEARDSKTTPERLVDLARDGDWAVRETVAGNTSAPQEVLTEMSRDRDTIARYWVARNTSAPSEVLTELSRDDAWTVRAGVAGNASAPDGTLILLTEDINDQVVKAAKATLASRTATPTLLWGMGV